MSKRSPRMKRRRFVTLVALSGAALAAAPLSRASAALSRAVAKAKTRAGGPPTPAIQREIRTQEKSLADQLQTIRKFELPTGSPMAFVFKPLRARRGR